MLDWGFLGKLSIIFIKVFRHHFLSGLKSLMPKRKAPSATTSTAKGRKKAKVEEEEVEVEDEAEQDNAEEKPKQKTTKGMLSLLTPSLTHLLIHSFVASSSVTTSIVTHHPHNTQHHAASRSTMQHHAALRSTTQHYAAPRSTTHVRSYYHPSSPSLIVDQ